MLPPGQIAGLAGVMAGRGSLTVMTTESDPVQPCPSSVEYVYVVVTVGETTRLISVEPSPGWPAGALLQRPFVYGGVPSVTMAPSVVVAVMQIVRSGPASTSGAG